MDYSLMIVFFRKPSTVDGEDMSFEESISKSSEESVGADNTTPNRNG